MKKSSRYIALTAAVLVLFGCTQEEILLQYDGKEVPITLSKVEVEGTVTTRATTTLLEEGSVGLFVKDTDVPDDSKYNAQNCHFEYENGAWKFVAEDGNTRPLYNYSELLGFSMQWAWAYSPYVADIDNAPAIELQATQTAESIAAQEKYLFTPSSEQVDENGSVSINFRHALSKVRVVVNKILPEDVDVSSIKSVTLSNILDKTAWDFTLDKAIGLKAPDDAVYTGTTTMYKVSDTEFEAVVLPCENTGSFNITLETTEGRKFVATVNYPNHANKDGFQSNYIYNVPVVVGVERISIGTVFVMPWTEVENPIDAGTATEPEASYSISGTTATITVPEYASAASVQAAITAVAADASVTTITVNGTLSDTQQTTLATALEGNTTLEIVFEDMNLADLSDDVKWMGNPIDTADGAILKVASCGENAQCMIYHTGDDNSRTVSIKGTGAMANYDMNSSFAPWFDQASYQIPNNITKVEIAEDITTIGDNTFGYGYGIASVTLPESITSIGWRGFASCSSLTSITIPKDVTSISSYAFAACRSLESVTVLATTPPTLGTNVFNNCSESLIIYVPSESVAEYRSKWSDYADKIQPIQ